MDDETAAQIDAIELAVIGDSFLGFDPTILSSLDNAEIGQEEIENIKSSMGADIFLHLFSIANSSYHGSLKMGPVKHFFDIVTRIGMQHTKAMIILFALHRLAHADQEAEMIFAKGFAASVVGRIMSRGFGVNNEGARKVELACLLSNIGALMMTVYGHRRSPGDLALSDEFIEKNHLYLTERVIKRFQLPEYLNDMIMADSFIIDRKGICLPTIAKLAIAAVEWSFRNQGNKLVFRSPQASLDDRFTPTIADMIEEQFAAAGLKKYLVINHETEIGCICY